MAVYGGFNDVFSALGVAAAGGDPSAIVNNAVNNIGAAIEGLASAGAANFLVLNLFDLGLTPQIAFVGMPSSSATANAVTRAFNSALDTRLDSIASSFAIHLIRFDTFDFFNSVVASPGAYGFTDAALPCARNTSVCGNPDSFVFWDGIHQTAAFNRVLANAIIQAVPEPGTSEILIFGLTALAFNYRRNKKHRAAARVAHAQPVL
jgi:phospholipase/lecithinase/hemolysin